MRICSISWEEIDLHAEHHAKGLKKLSPKLSKLKPLAFDAEELRKEAAIRSDKMSIQGVQPKISAVLDIKNARFDLVDCYGRYILKPPHLLYQEVPENESLSMSLGQALGFETPLHGLIKNKDQSHTYFVKRFDRYAQKSKYHQEDFAQLSMKNRDTKYDSSMEKVVDVIDRYCTFPAIERLELFKRVIFSFLIGNEDMHLKNHSVMIKKNIVKLSPIYDMLNTTNIISSAKEELALPIRGRKRKLSSEDMLSYFGEQRCRLKPHLIEAFLSHIRATLPRWEWMVQHSHLSAENKHKYLELIYERCRRLGL